MDIKARNSKKIILHLLFGLLSAVLLYCSKDNNTYTVEIKSIFINYKYIQYKGAQIRRTGSMDKKAKNILNLTY